MFKVHVGYTALGRNRWRRFYTIEGARAYVSAVFNTTGIVLTIIEGK